MDRNIERTFKLPFAILEDEFAALERFGQRATGEHDLPQEMMERLVRVGLVCRFNGVYEETTFGQCVQMGYFAKDPAPTIIDLSDALNLIEKHPERPETGMLEAFRLLQKRAAKRP